MFVATNFSGVGFMDMGTQHSISMKTREQTLWTRVPKHDMARDTGMRNQPKVGH